MSVAQFTKLLETVGIPVLTATVFGYALWFVLKWLLTKFSTDLTAQITAIGAEIDEEQRDVTEQIKEVKTIMIRLVDRVRLLDQSLLEHDAVARTVWHLPDREPRALTRSERRDELTERLAELQSQAGLENGKNED
jgi:hypothetical protein|tara:strand:+ start:67 stop:474 length:408 start_codon:yes stop_codon:yes gene_type:complete